MTTYDFLMQYVKEHNGKHINRQNFYIDGELTTYSTTICRIDGKNAYLNIHKYSRTTSKLQSQLKALLIENDYTIIEYDGEPAFMWNYGYCSSDNKWSVKELKERGIF